MLLAYRVARMLHKIHGGRREGPVRPLLAHQRRLGEHQARRRVERGAKRCRRLLLLFQHATSGSHLWYFPLCCYVSGFVPS